MSDDMIRDVMTNGIEEHRRYHEAADRTLYIATAEREGRIFHPAISVKGGPNHSPFTCFYPDLWIRPSRSRKRALLRAVKAAAEMAVAHGDDAVIHLDATPLP